MKMTLLEIVQQILSKMNSDEVNSIGDTIESLQVANEVKSTYEDIVAGLEFPEHNTLLSFEPSIDVNRPTHMRVSDNVDEFMWIYYNNGTAAAPNYVEVWYLKPQEFFHYLLSNQNTSSGTKVVQDYNGAYFVVRNDRHPRYYTMFDDEYIVFDSYLATTDDTLQESKVMAMGQTFPTFSLTDDFVPDLNAKHFPLLVSEATAACFNYFKQTASPTDERRARRNNYRVLNNQRRHTPHGYNHDFGRT